MREWCFTKLNPAPVALWNISCAKKEWTRILHQFLFWSVAPTKSCSLPEKTNTVHVKRKWPERWCVFPLKEHPGNFTKPSWYVRVSLSPGQPNSVGQSTHLGVRILIWPSIDARWDLRLTLAIRINQWEMIYQQTSPNLLKLEELPAKQCITTTNRNHLCFFHLLISLLLWPPFGADPSHYSVGKQSRYADVSAKF